MTDKAEEERGRGKGERLRETRVRNQTAKSRRVGLVGMLQNEWKNTDGGDMGRSNQACGRKHIKHAGKDEW